MARGEGQAVVARREGKGCVDVGRAMEGLVRVGGADVAAVDGGGLTALHHAVRCVRVLVCVCVCVCVCRCVDVCACVRGCMCM